MAEATQYTTDAQLTAAKDAVKKARKAVTDKYNEELKKYEDAPADAKPKKPTKPTAKEVNAAKEVTDAKNALKLLEANTEKANCDNLRSGLNYYIYKLKLEANLVKERDFKPKNVKLTDEEVKAGVTAEKKKIQIASDRVKTLEDQSKKFEAKLGQTMTKRHNIYAIYVTDICNTDRLQSYATWKAAFKALKAYDESKPEDQLKTYVKLVIALSKCDTSVLGKIDKTKKYTVKAKVGKTSQLFTYEDIRALLVADFEVAKPKMSVVTAKKVKTNSSLTPPKPKYASGLYMGNQTDVEYVFSMLEKGVAKAAAAKPAKAAAAKPAKAAAAKPAAAKPAAAKPAKAAAAKANDEESDDEEEELSVNEEEESDEERDDGEE